TLNTVVEAEKVAIAAAAQSKANADKLAEAAKPTPEEMSAIQTAEAEFKAANDQLAALQNRVERLKGIQSQLASATAQN
ncbi:MAG: hypothetical protein KDA80_18585, partial [Planctomycetaceae bacterium]|nr:hypothetical protein [Planctomycetaceae bacterium]